MSPRFGSFNPGSSWYLLLLAFVLQVAGCRNTQLPQPPKYTKALEGIQTFDFDGMQVLLRPGRPDVVALNLVFAGGTAQIHPSNQGIEALTLEALLRCGTQKRSPDAFADALEGLGAKLSVVAGPDFSALRLVCLQNNFYAAWSLVLEALLQPAFSPLAFKDMRQQWIASAQEAQGDDNQVTQLATDKFFGTHPYHLNPQGTPNVLAAITLDSVRKYQRLLVQKQRMRLVIVGPVQPELFFSRLMLVTDTLFMGQPALEMPPLPQTEPQGLVFAPADGGVGYLRGHFAGPDGYTTESVVLQLGLALLSERLQNDLCAKRHLTCSVSARYVPWKRGFATIDVQTAIPNLTMQVLMNHIREVAKHGFTSDEFEYMRKRFLTQYYAGLQTNEAVADALAAGLLRGNWQLVYQLPQLVQQMRVSAVNHILAQYLSQIHWYYVGDITKVNETLFKP